jgi:hypothetical protein
MAIALTRCMNGFISLREKYYQCLYSFHISLHGIASAHPLNPAMKPRQQSPFNGARKNPFEGVLTGFRLLFALAFDID